MQDPSIALTHPLLQQDLVVLRNARCGCKFLALSLFSLLISLIFAVLLDRQHFGVQESTITMFSQHMSLAGPLMPHATLSNVPACTPVHAPRGKAPPSSQHHMPRIVTAQMPLHHTPLATMPHLTHVQEARRTSPISSGVQAHVSDASDGTMWVFNATLLARYIAATAMEFAILLALLKGFDLAFAMVPGTALGGAMGAHLKPCVAWACFALLAVKSRSVSLLDASRPNEGTEIAKRVMIDRVRPAWQPPGIVFPIVWSIIGLLRATASLLAFNATGTAMCAPILALALHVSIGDTWNAMNNADGQLGFSVVWVWLGVLVSGVNAIRVFYGTSQAAGLILVPMVIWLTVASVLITHTWLLNGKMPLYPVKSSC